MCHHPQSATTIINTHWGPMRKTMANIVKIQTFTTIQSTTPNLQNPQLQCTDLHQITTQHQTNSTKTMLDIRLQHNSPHTSHPNIDTNHSLNSNTTNNLSQITKNLNQITNSISSQLPNNAVFSQDTQPPISTLIQDLTHSNTLVRSTVCSQ